MGTHPIFESDFDCLTEFENEMDVDRNIVLANFQACTTIEDIGLCLAILDQHDWDLQNAVHAALQSQENAGGASNNANPPITAAPPRLASPPRPSRPNRQITFKIHTQGSEKQITIDDVSHVGTLLQIIQLDCNMRADDPMQFDGWPGGEQPDRDIPLSILALP